MNNPELCVSLPTEIIDLVKRYDKGEKMAANARQILKKVMAIDGHKNPTLRTFGKGRKTLAISLPKSMYDELLEYKQGSLSAYISTLLESYFRP